MRDSRESNEDEEAYATPSRAIGGRTRRKYASVVADDVKLIPALVELLQGVGYENTIALHPIRANQLGSWKTMRDVLHTSIHGESEA